MSRNSSNDNGFQGGDRGAGQGGVGKGDAGNGGVDRVAVQLMLDFQTTGRGFEPLWDRIGPAMDGTVRGLLRKRLVKGAKGGVDGNAVAESTQHVMIKLWELPRKGPKAWFRPSGSEGGADSLRGWLSGFCRHAVAAYCEKWRKPRRRRTVITESSLPLNELGEMQSLVERAVAKVDVRDRELEQIVNECVEALPDKSLRDVIRLNVWEGMAEREIEAHTRIHVSTVHRHLVRARKLLKNLLEDRGVDGSWLDGSWFDDKA